MNNKQTKTSEARVSGMRLWNKELEKNQIFLKEATSSATLGAKAGDLTPVSPVQEWLSVKGAGRMPWHQEPTKDAISCDKPRGAANGL